MPRFDGFWTERVGQTDIIPDVLYAQVFRTGSVAYTPDAVTLLLKGSTGGESLDPTDGTLNVYVTPTSNGYPFSVTSFQAFGSLPDLDLVSKIAWVPTRVDITSVSAVLLPDTQYALALDHLRRAGENSVISLGNALGFANGDLYSSITGGATWVLASTTVDDLFELSGDSGLSLGQPALDAEDHLGAVASADLNAGGLGQADLDAVEYLGGVADAEPERW